MEMTRRSVIGAALTALAAVFARVPLPTPATPAAERDALWWLNNPDLQMTVTGEDAPWYYGELQPDGTFKFVEVIPPPLTPRAPLPARYVHPSGRRGWGRI